MFTHVGALAHVAAIQAQYRAPTLLRNRITPRSAAAHTGIAPGFVPAPLPDPKHPGDRICTYYVCRPDGKGGTICATVAYLC
jgi:hypothetical protein